MIVRHHARAVLLSLWRLLCLSVLLLLSSLPTISQAQITLDGSLGHRGALHGPNYTISDRVGQIRGPNLFHSFRQFNLSKGESATFTGPNTIANILSRVTGGSPSNIDGTIRSQIPKANFYLINPSGVMFGPNASLDVSGSFHVSTADYLRLADGATFSAHLAVPTVLSVAPPAAFGFLGPTPESITVKGSTRLQVPSGETFAIVGGEITIAGNPEQSVVGVPTLSAFGGRIHLESVGSAGEVALPQPGQPLDREVGSVARAGTVSLIKGARIDASTADTGQAGRVTVVARDVRLEDRDTRILARTNNRGNGGEITIHADTLTLLGPASGVGGPHIDVSTQNPGTGHGGRVTVEARDVHLEGGESRIAAMPSDRGAGGEIAIHTDTLTLIGTSSQIDVSSIGRDSQGTGPAGHVTVVARDVRLEGGRILAQTNNRGDGGEINVQADRLTLTRNAEINSSTAGAGHGGRVRVTARDVRLEGGRILAQTNNRGDGGEINVQADRLTLTRNAEINSSTAGAGHGGRVRVTAREVLLEGGGIEVGTGGGGGAGGEVVIRAGMLTLTGEARINGSSGGAGRGGDITVMASEAIVLEGQGQEPARIASDARSTGAAGRVMVSAPTVRLDNGRIQAIDNESGSGLGGEVNVQGDTITLTRGARISSSSFGAGQGGNVTVAANTTILIAEASSEIAATANGSGDGGRVVVSAPTVRLEASGRITTEVGLQTATGAPSPGNAGNIEVQAGTITILGGGRITSRTRGAGQGGNVTVMASEAIVIAGPGPGTTPSGLRSNTEERGQGGNIRVQAPRVELSDRAAISAASTGSGHAGTVTVRAGTLTLTGGAEISSSSGQVDAQGQVVVGTGPAGNVTLSATEMLAITGRDQTGTLPSRVVSQTFGTGPAGQVTIMATPWLTMAEGGRIGTDTGGDGRAGDVVVQVGSVALASGAQISSSSGFKANGTLRVGKGSGGTVTVTATEALLISGQDSTGSESGVFSQTFGLGDAGRIAVIMPRLTLADGGRISAETGGDGHGGDVTVQASRLELMSGAQITSSSGITLGPTRLVGAGGGGTVTLTATAPVLLTGQGTGLFTRTAGPGQGGDITVQAPRVTLADGATISAESTGLGNAGNITLTLGDSFVSTHGSIVTRATQADGGNIQITASNFLRLRDSAITAEVGGGATTIGGNIFIDPQFVLLQNSQIVANAFAGQGGSIRIQAQQVFLADPTSQVSASSALGINGQVAIQAPVANISGAVAALPQAFARAGELLRDRCGERARGGTVSRFVLGGRDGVPLEPGSLLLSPPVRAEQPAPVRMTDTVAGQRAVSFGPVGGLESDNTSSLSLRGQYGQAQGLEALDVECARWRWMQGTDIKTVP